MAAACSVAIDILPPKITSVPNFADDVTKSPKVSAHVNFMSITLKRCAKFKTIIVGRNLSP